MSWAWGKENVIPGTPGHVCGFRTQSWLLFSPQEQSKALQESLQNIEHLENKIQSLEKMAKNGEGVNKVYFV